MPLKACSAPVAFRRTYLPTSRIWSSSIWEPTDPWHQYYQEAYEGIVSQLLAAGIPVINFNVCPSNGENVQAKQQPVNKRYGIPQISFRSSYWANREENKNITGLRAADIWSSDTVHPTDKGHELIANLITSYLQTAILDAGISPAKQNTALPAPVTANRYKDAILVESKDTLPAGMSIETSGWTADYAARTAEFKTEGWQAKSLRDAYPERKRRLCGALLYAGRQNGQSGNQS